MTEVPFPQHNDVVKAFPADRTDQPFGISVLPWRARRCRSIANAHGSQSSNEDLAIGTIPVTDEIAGRLFPAAGCGELICDPFSRRMRRDAKPQNLSSAMPHNQ